MNLEPPQGGNVDSRERRYYEYARVWRRLVAGLVDWLAALVWGGVIYAAVEEGGKRWG